jgi:hypothetical protein
MTPLLPTVESHNCGVPHHGFTIRINKKIWCKILSKCEEKIEMEYFFTILPFKTKKILPDFEKEKNYSTQCKNSPRQNMDLDSLI